jgi:hypothetical protein
MAIERSTKLAHMIKSRGVYKTKYYVIRETQRDNYFNIIVALEYEYKLLNPSGVNAPGLQLVLAGEVSCV